MNYIVAAILSNLSYAFADNVNGLISKKNSPLKVALWVSIFGAIIFFIPAIIFFGSEIQKLTFINTIIMFSINILLAVGYLFFMTSMSRGNILLTGVIGTSYPAVTTIAALLIFGEVITVAQLLAITVVLIGVVLSSMHGKAKDLFKGVKASGIIFAFGTCLLWGLYFALVRIPVESIGWFLPQYSYSFVGIIIFLIIAKLTSDKGAITRPELVWLIILSALLQLGGTMFFNYAISQGQTAIVAPIAGSSAAVFVVIAYFLFKERLNAKQWTGIILTLIGIIGLSFLSTL